MIAAFESLLPIFLLIGLGFILRRRGIVPEDMWRGIELLGYWVFFPALLTDTMVRADLAELPLTGISSTMISAFIIMSGGLLLARKKIQSKLGIGGATFSSIFQSSTRWNGFIALPILAKLHGEMGVALVAIVMGFLVPLANLVNVVVVAHNAGHQQPSVGETAWLVFRNPFIWATAIGLSINLAQVPIYDPLMTCLGILGGAAIGTGLLMVGAGLRIAEAARPSPAVWLGAGLKLIGMPALVATLGLILGLGGVPLLACLVCAAVPTAMSAYVLAREMGGDAPLVAATVTVQTAVSFATIPLIIVLAQWLA